MSDDDWVEMQPAPIKVRPEPLADGRWAVLVPGPTPAVRAWGLSDFARWGLTPPEPPPPPVVVTVGTSTFTLTAEERDDLLSDLPHLYIRALRPVCDKLVAALREQGVGG